MSKPALEECPKWQLLNGRCSSIAGQHCIEDPCREARSSPRFHFRLHIESFQQMSELSTLLPSQIGRVAWLRRWFRALVLLFVIMSIWRLQEEKKVGMPTQVKQALDIGRENEILRCRSERGDA